MELLLKRGRLGEVVEGSGERLITRARAGDDLTIFEESSAFDCFIVFPNYFVSADRVCALSLKHMAHGELADPSTLAQASLSSIQYIYDSCNKHLLCKEALDTQSTLTSIWSNNPHYANLTWYSTRRYVECAAIDLASIRSRASEIKVRLDLNDKVKLVFKPEHVSAPAKRSESLIKSSMMILPSEFASDPETYLTDEKPLLANKKYSDARLIVRSDRSLTIQHSQRYSIEENIDRALERAVGSNQPTARFESYQEAQSHSLSRISELKCDYTILFPETGSETHAGV